MNPCTAPSCPPANWTTLSRPARVVVFSFRLTQSKVSDDFRMQVPIYSELAHGNVVFVGRARLAGDCSVEQQGSIKGLKAKPRRAQLNYYDDVLASPN
jgi:hypothetical protein